jgi:calcineurin-like phosphoesterase family protein
MSSAAPERWVFSDPHFGHENAITKFVRNNGRPLREFKDVEDMNETMIANYNAVVGDYDRTYCLGDVVINKKFLHLTSRLKGKKYLIMGNHDIFGAKKYLETFEDVKASEVRVDDMIMSHIPLHPECVTDRFVQNVHGHLHANVLNDPRFLCVSVEQTNYVPLNLQQVRDRFQQNREAFAETGQVINFSDTYY